jgi:uncharacterized delta-60 repeat protein
MSGWNVALASAVVTATLVVAPSGTSRPAAQSRDWAYALAIQKDGKVVAAGLSRAPGRDSFALSRYTLKGRLDAGFGREGRVLTSFPSSGPAKAVATQRDGKIVAAGGSGFRRGQVFALARYTPRGSLDHSFGHGGIVAAALGPAATSAATATAMAIQRDGKIVAAGWSGRPIVGPYYFAVARYMPKGQLDASFGQGGKVLSRGYQATDMAIQPDGKIVVAAYGGTGGTIARYTPRGVLDPSFGRGGVVAVVGVSTLALALQKDGEIVIAGAAQGATNSADFAVARYTTEGRVDTTFGDDGIALANFGRDPTGNTAGSGEAASAVAIQTDGKIAAAGRTDVRGVFCGGKRPSFAMAPRAYTPASLENLSICDDFALARFNADGSLDTTFGKQGEVVTSFVNRPGSEGSSSLAEALGIQADGRIVVAGLGNGYDFALARYTTSGQLDASFGRGGKVLTDFGSG